MSGEHPTRCATSRFRSVLLYVLLVVFLVALGSAQSAAAQSPSAASDDAGILLYKLPGTAVKSGLADTEVVLAVEIDGVVLSTQTVQVPPEDPPRDRLLGVLSGQPAERANIERRLRGGGDNAAVVVRIDGKEYQRLTWKQLLAASAAVTTSAPDSPQSVDITEALTPGQQQCSARCDEEYDQCLRTCEPFSGPNACWDCRTQVEACGSFCATCPRKWTSYGSWTEVLPRVTTRQYLCAYEQSAGGRRLHQEWLRTFKRTVTEFTEHCDHNITRTTSTQTTPGENCWTQVGPCNFGNDVFGSRKKCP